MSDTAIEALKYSETPKSSERTSETAQNVKDGDSVFRQAAIDCVTYDVEHTIECLKALPSAQPDHVADIGKKVEGDCISRQAAVDAICNACGKIDCDKMDKCEKLQLPPANCSEFPNNSDTISRQMAIDALARMMPRSYTPDGSHPADEEIFRAQEVFADCIEALEILPSAAPSTAQTTEATAPSTDDWIPVERELPEDLAEVNVTWVNHEPEPYYEPIKSKPFTASAVYYEGNWYWYSSVCADVLAEYGRNDVDKVDDAIEITAWMPLPEPYRGGDA